RGGAGWARGRGGREGATAGRPLFAQRIPVYSAPQTSIEGRSVPAARASPVGEKATEVAQGAETEKVSWSLPVLGSQSRTLPSSPALASREAEGWKARAETACGCPVSTAVRSPVSALQRRRVRSTLPLATREPSGEKTTAVTVSWWARKPIRVRSVSRSTISSIPPSVP